VRVRVLKQVGQRADGAARAAAFRAPVRVLLVLVRVHAQELRRAPQEQAALAAADAECS
jgi:hypothetical protein